MMRAVEDVLEEIGAGEQPAAARAQQGRPARRARRACAPSTATATRCSSRRRPARASTRCASASTSSSCSQRVARRAAAALRRGRAPRRAARARRRARARGHPRGRARARAARAGRRRALRALRGRPRDVILPVARLRAGARRCRRAPTTATPASTSTPPTARASSPGARCEVGTGIAVAIPAGHAGLVLPRSGLAARHGIALVNAPGLIDAGYRGELRVLLLNTDRERRLRGRRRATASPSC